MDTVYPTELGIGPWSPTDDEWQVQIRDNPFCRFADRTGDQYFRARRLTDVVDMGIFARTELFSRGGRNFSRRDVLVIDALRAPLIA